MYKSLPCPDRFIVVVTECEIKISKREDRAGEQGEESGFIWWCGMDRFEYLCESVG